MDQCLAVNDIVLIIFGYLELEKDGSQLAALASSSHLGTRQGNWFISVLLEPALNILWDMQPN